MRDWLVVGVWATLQRYFNNRNRRAKMDMTLENILFFFAEVRRGCVQMFRNWTPPQNRITCRKQKLPQFSRQPNCCIGEDALREFAMC